ncbi:MAG: excinuclease ABC subunit UvrC [Bdellovibrionales bacterium]
MSNDKSSLKEQVKSFPNTPGVYIMKNGHNKILYIGKAKSLKTRVLAYFNTNNLTLKNQFLVHQMKVIDYWMTKNEVEAFLLEASLIKKHKPRYNVRLTDDKNYPYIRCSMGDSFPRFYFERRVKDSQSLYFGPYTQGSFTRQMLDFLNQNFQLRDCSDADFKTRKRPCLIHQMGFCTAPCVDLVSEKSYRKQVQKALRFLRGQHKGLIKTLQQQMNQFSKEFRYEEAGRIRDYLKAIEMIDQHQSVIQNSDKDKDVVIAVGDERGTLLEFLHLRKGRLISSHHSFLPKTLPEEEPLLSYLNQYYQENIIPDELLLEMNIQKLSLQVLEQVLSQKKQNPCKIFLKTEKEDEGLIQLALKNARNHFEDAVKKSESRQDILLEIKNKFHLKQLPLRIECYDISHWQGSHTIGSQVVFENGLPFKKEYRLYQLKQARQKDDYASLKEVLERRLKHTEYEDPDFILVDGGRGQLGVVHRVLKDLNRAEIPLVSLAKDRVQSDIKSSSLVSSGERFYLVGRKNPVSFSSSSPAFSLLLQIRDEAHRFAITAHRRKRDRDFLVGDLDQIKGLGFKTKQKLFDHFKSLESLKRATEQELLDLPFLSEKLAHQIKLYFSNPKK